MQRNELNEQIDSVCAAFEKMGKGDLVRYWQASDGKKLPPSVEIRVDNKRLAYHSEEHGKNPKQIAERSKRIIETIKLVREASPLEEQLDKICDSIINTLNKNIPNNNPRLRK